jgi:hypothetical protein
MSKPPAPRWTTQPAIPWDPTVEPEALVTQEVVYDLYPARICPVEAEQNAQFNLCWRGRVRVIVTRTMAYFFVEVPEAPGIGLLHSEPLVTASGGRSEPGGILIELEGGSLRAHKDKGCGCGSRLRSLRPFPNTVQVSL